MGGCHGQTTHFVGGSLRFASGGYKPVQADSKVAEFNIAVQPRYIYQSSLDMHFKRFFTMGHLSPI